MTPGPVCWHGTDAERERLLAALAAACDCRVDGAGVRTSTCGPHTLLLSQRALDGLVYVRRRVQDYTYREWQWDGQVLAVGGEAWR